MNRDEEHLKLLEIFHYVVAGVTALLACIPFIHLTVGLIFLLAPAKFAPGQGAPSAIVGWLFVVVASFMILCGWTLAILILTAGRFLAKRKHHTFCLVMAGVECIFMPF